MAKKSKRNVSKTTRTASSGVNKTTVAEEKIQVAASGGSRFSTAFNPDYAPVRKDLTRIAILAGVFFVILIVLSFFLR